MRLAFTPHYLLGATLLLSTIAHGEEPPQSHAACMQEAITTVDMVMCTTKEFEREDQRLNENYQQLRSQLSEARRE